MASDKCHAVQQSDAFCHASIVYFHSMWRLLLLARVKFRSSLQMAAKKPCLRKKGASAFWWTSTVALPITYTTITGR